MELIQDIHICGACREKFTDIEQFIQHKKKCGVSKFTSDISQEYNSGRIWSEVGLQHQNHNNVVNAATKSENVGMSLMNKPLVTKTYSTERVAHSESESQGHDDEVDLVYIDAQQSGLYSYPQQNFNSGEKFRISLDKADTQSLNLNHGTIADVAASEPNRSQGFEITGVVPTWNSSEGKTEILGQFQASSNFSGERSKGHRLNENMVLEKLQVNLQSELTEGPSDNVAVYVVSSQSLTPERLGNMNSADVSQHIFEESGKLTWFSSQSDALDQCLASDEKTHTFNNGVDVRHEDSISAPHTIPHEAEKQDLDSQIMRRPLLNLGLDQDGVSQSSTPCPEDLEVGQISAGIVATAKAYSLLTHQSNKKEAFLETPSQQTSKQDGKSQPTGKRKESITDTPTVNCADYVRENTLSAPPLKSNTELRSLRKLSMEKRERLQGVSDDLMSSSPYHPSASQSFDIGIVGSKLHDQVVSMAQTTGSQLIPALTSFKAVFTSPLTGSHRLAPKHTIDLNKVALSSESVSDDGKEVGSSNKNRSLVGQFTTLYKNISASARSCASATSNDPESRRPVRKVERKIEFEAEEEQISNRSAKAASQDTEMNIAQSDHASNKDTERTTEKGIINQFKNESSLQFNLDDSHPPLQGTSSSKLEIARVGLHRHSQLNCTDVEIATRIQDTQIHEQRQERLEQGSHHPVQQQPVASVSHYHSHQTGSLGSQVEAASHHQGENVTYPTRDEVMGARNALTVFSKEFTEAPIVTSEAEREMTSLEPVKVLSAQESSTLDGAQQSKISSYIELTSVLSAPLPSTSSHANMIQTEQPVEREKYIMKPRSKKLNQPSQNSSSPASAGGGVVMAQTTVVAKSKLLSAKTKVAQVEETMQDVDIEESGEEEAGVISNNSPHSEGKPVPRFRCEHENCTYSTSMYKDILRHQRTHTGECPFVCEECGKKFNRSDKLKVHMRWHLGLKPFRCTYCKYATVEAGSLKKHIRIHTGERPFKCQICPYSSRNSSHLIVHLRTHTGDAPYHCDKCSAQFKINSDLKRHLLIHTGEKPFHCTQCDYKCSYKGNLKTHYRINHSKDNEKRCSKCDFATSSAKKYREHVKTHDSKRVVRCTQCDYTCSNLNALRNHMTIHNPARPFQCYLCPYSSKQSGNLKKHIQNVHFDSVKSRRHGKNFTSASSEVVQTAEQHRNQHVSASSQEVAVPEYSRPRRSATCRKLHECAVCGCKFVREDSLRCHMKCHPGAKIEASKEQATPPTAAVLNPPAPVRQSIHHIAAAASQAFQEQFILAGKETESSTSSTLGNTGSANKHNETLVHTVDVRKHSSLSNVVKESEVRCQKAEIPITGHRKKGVASASSTIGGQGESTQGDSPSPFKGQVPWEHRSYTLPVADDEPVAIGSKLATASSFHGTTPSGIWNSVKSPRAAVSTSLNSRQQSSKKVSPSSAGRKNKSSPSESPKRKSKKQKMSISEKTLPNRNTRTTATVSGRQPSSNALQQEKTIQSIRPHKQEVLIQPIQPSHLVQGSQPQVVYQDIIVQQRAPGQNQTIEVAGLQGGNSTLILSQPAMAEPVEQTYNIQLMSQSIQPTGAQQTDSTVTLTREPLHQLSMQQIAAQPAAQIQIILPGASLQGSAQQVEPVQPQHSYPGQQPSRQILLQVPDCPGQTPELISIPQALAIQLGSIIQIVEHLPGTTIQTPQGATLQPHQIQLPAQQQYSSSLPQSLSSSFSSVSGTPYVQLASTPQESYVPVPPVQGSFNNSSMPISSSSNQGTSYSQLQTVQQLNSLVSSGVSYAQLPANQQGISVNANYSQLSIGQHSAGIGGTTTSAAYVPQATVQQGTSAPSSLSTLGSSYIQLSTGQQYVSGTSSSFTSANSFSSIPCEMQIVDATGVGTDFGGHSGLMEVHVHSSGQPTGQPKVNPGMLACVSDKVRDSAPSTSGSD